MSCSPKSTPEFLAIYLQRRLAPLRDAKPGRHRATRIITPRRAVHVRGARHETVQTYAARCERCGDRSPVSHRYEEVRQWRDDHERERHDMSHRRTFTGVFEARCSCGVVSPALEQYADVGRWRPEHEREVYRPSP